MVSCEEGEAVTRKGHHLALQMFCFLTWVGSPDCVHSAPSSFGHFSLHCISIKTTVSTKRCNKTDHEKGWRRHVHRTYYFSFLLYLAGRHSNLLFYQTGSLLLYTGYTTTSKENKMAEALTVKILACLKYLKITL